MVRGLRIFFPLPFTRNPESSHLSEIEKSARREAEKERASERERDRNVYLKKRQKNVWRYKRHKTLAASMMNL